MMWIVNIVAYHKLPLINIQKYWREQNVYKKGTTFRSFLILWSVWFLLKPFVVNKLVCACDINKNKAKIIFPVFLIKFYRICHLITEARFDRFRWSKVAFSHLMKWWSGIYNTAGFIHIKVHINICTSWTNTGRLFEVIWLIKSQQGNVIVKDFKTGHEFREPAGK